MTCQSAILQSAFVAHRPLGWTVQLLLSVRQFRNETRTGAEMCLAIASGMVTEDAPVGFVLSPQDVHDYFCSISLGDDDRFLRN